MSDLALAFECPDCGAAPGRACTWGTRMSRGRAETKLIVGLLRVLAVVFVAVFAVLAIWGAGQMGQPGSGPLAPAPAHGGHWVWVP